MRAKRSLVEAFIALRRQSAGKRSLPARPGVRLFCVSSLVCLFAMTMAPSALRPAQAQAQQKKKGPDFTDFPTFENELLQIRKELGNCLDSVPKEGPAFFVNMAERVRRLQVRSEPDNGKVSYTGDALGGGVGGFFPSFIIGYCYWRAAFLYPADSPQREKCFANVNGALSASVTAETRTSSKAKLPIRSLLNENYRSPMLLKMLVVSRLRMGARTIDSRLLPFLKTIAQQGPDEVPDRSVGGIAGDLVSKKSLQKQVDDEYQQELKGFRFEIIDQAHVAEAAGSDAQIISGRGQSAISVRIVAYDAADPAKKEIAQDRLKSDGSFSMEIKETGEAERKVALRWEPVDPEIGKYVPDLKGAPISMTPVSVATPAHILLERTAWTETDQLKTKIGFQVTGLRPNDRVLLDGKEVKAAGPGPSPKSQVFSQEVPLKPDTANSFEIQVEHDGKLGKTPSQIVVTSRTRPRVTVAKMKGDGPGVLRVQVSDYVGIKNLQIDGLTPWEGPARAGMDPDGRKAEVYLIPWLLPRDSCLVTFNRSDGQSFRVPLPTAPANLTEVDDAEARDHAGPAVAALLKNDIPTAQAELIKLKENEIAHRTLGDLFDRLVAQRLRNKLEEEKRLNGLRGLAEAVDKTKSKVLDEYLASISWPLELKSISATRIDGPVALVHVELSGYQANKHRITAIEAAGVAMTPEMDPQAFARLLSLAGDTPSLDLLVKVPPGDGNIQVKVTYKDAAGTNFLPINVPVGVAPAVVPSRLEEDRQRIIAEKPDGAPWIKGAWRARTEWLGDEEVKKAGASGATVTDALTALDRGEEIYKRLSDSATKLQGIASRRDEILETVRPRIERQFKNNSDVLKADRGKIEDGNRLLIRTSAKQVQVTIGEAPPETVAVPQGGAGVNLAGRAASAGKLEIKVQVVDMLPGARTEFLHALDRVDVLSLSAPEWTSAELCNAKFDVTPVLDIDRETSKFGAGGLIVQLKNAKRAEYRVRPRGAPDDDNGWVKGNLSDGGEFVAQIAKGQCELGGKYDVDIRAWENEQGGEPVRFKSYPLNMPNRCIAFVLGIDHYSNNDLYPNLTYPSKDARDIIEMLRTKFGYEPANIVYVLGYSEKGENYVVSSKHPIPQKGVVDSAVYSENIKELGDRALALAPYHGFVFVACHGAVKVYGGVELNRLILADGLDVPVNEAAQAILKVQDKCFPEKSPGIPVTVELVDACRNKTDNISGSPDFLKTSRAQLLPIFSCKDGQKANENLPVSEYPDLALKDEKTQLPIEHGFFTYSVLQALRDLAAENPIAASRFIDATSVYLQSLVERAKGVMTRAATGSKITIDWNDKQSLLAGGQYPPQLQPLPIVYKPGAEKSMGFTTNAGTSAGRYAHWTTNLLDFAIATR